MFQQEESLLSVQQQSSLSAHCSVWKVPSVFPRRHDPSFSCFSSSSSRHNLLPFINTFKCSTGTKRSPARAERLQSLLTPTHTATPTMDSRGSKAGNSHMFSHCAYHSQTNRWQIPDINVGTEERRLQQDHRAQSYICPFPFYG